jgi:hypothetical protein
VIGWGLAAVVGGISVAFARMGRYHRPAFHDAWSAWAARRGVPFGEPHGKLAVQLDVGHARVVASVAPDPATFGLRTLVEASWVLVAGPSFELADAAQAMAFAPPDWADFGSGDAALDARLVRRAPVPDVAAHALDARARELLAGLPPFSLRAGAYGLALHLPGAVEDHAVLDAAVALVGHLAALDVEPVLAVLRDLPGAEVTLPLHDEAGPRPLGATLVAPGVTLSYTASHGRRVTLARAKLPAAHPSGWFHIDAEGHPDAVLEPGPLPPELLPLLSGVGDSVLRFGAGRVGLLMDGAVVDPARLLAAADVCQALAAASAEGVYR